MEQSKPSNRGPRVGIGLPVYNGENYLADALDSLLAQTFTDFELFISDNASSDATAEICKRYAGEDPRIRYERQASNMGAAWNQNHVIRSTRGEYFKLAAHDDLCEPEFLTRCVEEADAQPEHVLVFPRTTIMFMGYPPEKQFFEDYLDTANPRPSVRFRELLFKAVWCAGFRVFGLMRRDALLQTPLFGDYKAADDILMIRMALLGPFLKLPERLFVYRRHEQQSVTLEEDAAAYYAWWGNKKARVFPSWRYLGALVDAIAKAPVGFAEKNRCRQHVLRWLGNRRKNLFHELITLGHAGPET